MKVFIIVQIIAISRYCGFKMEHSAIMGIEAALMRSWYQLLWLPPTLVFSLSDLLKNQL